MIPTTFWNVCASVPVGDGLRAACFQAEATRQAGKLALIGATRGMAGSLIGGALALAAGVFVLVAAQYQARYTRATDIARAAGTFLGEIKALKAFLSENDVVGTLRARAAPNEQMFFHPGENWCQAYFVDPTRLGLVGGSLPAHLAYWFSRTRGEIGRLIWLHRMTPEEVAEKRDWLPSEQIRSANTLERLMTSADGLIMQLHEERKSALQWIEQRDSRTMTVLISHLAKMIRDPD